MVIPFNIAYAKLVLIQFYYLHNMSDVMIQKWMMMKAYGEELKWPKETLGEDS